MKKKGQVSPIEKKIRKKMKLGNYQEQAEQQQNYFKNRNHQDFVLTEQNKYEKRIYNNKNTDGIRSLINKEMELAKGIKSIIDLPELDEKPPTPTKSISSSNTNKIWQGLTKYEDKQIKDSYVDIKVKKAKKEHDLIIDIKE